MAVELVFVHILSLGLSFLDSLLHSFLSLFLCSLQLAPLGECHEKGMDEAYVVVSPQTVLELQTREKEISQRRRDRR
jgi:hypothetical protein